MNKKTVLATLMSATMTLSLAVPALAAPAALEKFADVDSNAWYAEAVAHVADKGSMKGTDKGFEPDSKVTLATVYQLAYNMSGETVQADGAWYAAALKWAAEKGLYVGDDFEDGVVTREEAVSILYKAMGKESTAVLDFTDLAEVEDMDAFRWAVETGLIASNDEGKLLPKGELSRAELAQMLYNLDTAEAKAVVGNGLVYVAGASMQEKVEGENKVYTYNAIVDGEIVELTGTAKKFDGPYNTMYSDGSAYSKMMLENEEYEIVVGDFAKAKNGVVTLGGKELKCADGVVLYVIDLDGNITVGSVEKDYKSTKNYTIKVMYTTNEAGEVDTFYVRQNASKNYTTEEELIAAAEKAGMTSAVLTDTHGNRANVKYLVQDEKGDWFVKFDVTSDSWCGRTGARDDKKEGDGASPTGMYPIFLHFGTLESPEVKEGVSYTQFIELSHFWVDGEVNGSGLYNKFVITENVADSIPDTAYGKYDYVVLDTTFESKDDLNARRESLGFNSQERLYEETVAYAYASSIEYNTSWVIGKDGKVTYDKDAIVDGDGSVIFFHCQSGGATAGCISIPEENYKTFLETVDAQGAMIAIN